MTENLKAQEAHNLRTLALQLRQSAFETDDEHYIALFLCGAQALEARAGQYGNTPFLN